MRGARSRHGERGPEHGVAHRSHETSRHRRGVAAARRCRPACRERQRGQRRWSWRADAGVPKTAQSRNGGVRKVDTAAQSPLCRRVVWTPMAKKPNQEVGPKTKRPWLSQAEVPGYSLEQALRIPMAIQENYAGKPTTPLRVASAMEVQPSSSRFRQLCNAAIAYGLTEGGNRAAQIKLATLGKRITHPTVEKDELVAKREALLKPRVIREFLTQYNGNPIPKDNIARNVLSDMGVPKDRTSTVLALITSSAEALGLIAEIRVRAKISSFNPL